jgi:hypothetical protein
MSFRHLEVSAEKRMAFRGPAERHLSVVFPRTACQKTLGFGVAFSRVSIAVTRSRLISAKTYGNLERGTACRETSGFTVSARASLIGRFWPFTENA